MKFLIDFVTIYSLYIFHLSPVLIFLASVIIGLALVVGKSEKWKKRDSIYFGFITATTVGYGDKTPKSIKTKFIAIIITFVGLITTGIFVAAGMQALAKTIEKNIDRTEFDKDMAKVMGKEEESESKSVEKHIEDKVQNQINEEVKRLIDLKIKNLSKIRDSISTETPTTEK